MFWEGEMKHQCASDKGFLRYGDRVVQLIRGRCYMGYITPAFGLVMLEWHFGCFDHFPLVPQNVLTAPYRCQRCFKRIVHGDDVMCFVAGRETDWKHSVCERRGYEVYSARHRECVVGAHYGVS
jgi:hypothetical protein